MGLMRAGVLGVLALAGPCWCQPAGPPHFAAPAVCLDLDTATAAREGGRLLALSDATSPASTEREIADFLSTEGTAIPLAATLALLAADEPPQRHVGELAGWSIAYTTAATHLLKAAIDSPRPNRTEVRNGFPSGHASMTFAFARSVAEESDAWGAAAYAWAAGVAWSRVRRGDHDIPQVLAGAALGWWIADRVARDRRPRLSRTEDE